MSEIPAELHPPDFERAEPEETFVDRRINTLIDGYLEGLSWREQFDFDHAASSLGDRVNRVVGALREKGDEDSVATAVTLKAMHAVRYLDGAVSRFQPDYPVRNYYFHIDESPDGQFAGNVDRTIEAVYNLLAREKYGVVLGEIRRLYESSSEREAWVDILGDLGGYRLVRETVARYGHLETAVYYSTPLNLVELG